MDLDMAQLHPKAAEGFEGLELGEAVFTEPKASGNSPHLGLIDGEDNLRRTVVEDFSCQANVLGDMGWDPMTSSRKNSLLSRHGQ
nr:hypothetical protein DOP62_09215 [Synechococcus elongatus PCC 11801]